MLVPDYACRSCRRYDRILPEGLVPYKHCVAATIERILNKETDAALDQEESTRRGWRGWFDILRAAANPLLNKLRRRTGSLPGLLLPVEKDVGDQPAGWLSRLVFYVIYANHRIFNQLAWHVHSATP